MVRQTIKKIAAQPGIVAWRQLTACSASGFYVDQRKLVALFVISIILLHNLYLLHAKVIAEPVR
jgi:hypothetical protein